MDRNNYRKRVLHCLVQELELPKLTFQVIRRTIATLAQKEGTVKDIQDVLRHSRIATTTDVYMQEIPASVQKPVNAISASCNSFLTWKRSGPSRGFCYQMLSSWKKGLLQVAENMVDLVGIEPTTSSMPWKRAPSCATGPHGVSFPVRFSPTSTG